MVMSSSIWRPCEIPKIIITHNINFCLLLHEIKCCMMSRISFGNHASVYCDLWFSLMSSSTLLIEPLNFLFVVEFPDQRTRGWPKWFTQPVVFSSFACISTQEGHESMNWPDANLTFLCNLLRAAEYRETLLFYLSRIRYTERICFLVIHLRTSHFYWWTDE